MINGDKEFNCKIKQALVLKYPFYNLNELMFVILLLDFSILYICIAHLAYFRSYIVNTLLKNIIFFLLNCIAGIKYQQSILFCKFKMWHGSIKESTNICHIYHFKLAEIDLLSLIQIQIVLLSTQYRVLSKYIIALYTDALFASISVACMWALIISKFESQSFFDLWAPHRKQVVHFLSCRHQSNAHQTDSLSSIKYVSLHTLTTNQHVSISLAH